MFLNPPSVIFKTFIPPSPIQLKSTFLSSIPQSTLQLDPILLHLQFLSFHFLSFLSLPSFFSLFLVLLSHKSYLQFNSLSPIFFSTSRSFFPTFSSFRSFSHFSLTLVSLSPIFSTSRPFSLFFLLLHVVQFFCFSFLWFPSPHYIWINPLYTPNSFPSSFSHIQVPTP